MANGPHIAHVAALMGDPARANMLTALLDGRALTVSELAEVGGVALPTASGHLAKLDQAGLLTAERQGRHRYFRLSGPDVAEVLESLMSLAERTGHAPIRTGPRDAALRHARVCYDHLAGEMGVALMAGAVARGWIDSDAEPRLTEPGRRYFEDMGLDFTALDKRRRPLCLACLDWSERRHHLAGGLGAALLDHMTAKGWARRAAGRTIVFSAPGRAAFDKAFAVAA